VSELASRDIIDRIMSSPVPDKARLSNPVAAVGVRKKKTRNQQITLSHLLNESDEVIGSVKEWTARTLLDYFAAKFQDKTDRNYKRIYQADGPYFTQMMRFMASNGLNKSEWTKHFIDWCFDHYKEITRKHNSFAPVYMLSYLNRFYQEIVMPKVEDDTIERDHHDLSLVEEVAEAEKEGKVAEIFGKFGIPVAATYFVKQRGYSEDFVDKAVRKRLESLKEKGQVGAQQIERMFQMSVLNSPYPDDFAFLDWRNRFKEYAKPSSECAWWRESDYKGKPLPKYKALL
jgi:hypothetical protein